MIDVVMERVGCGQGPGIGPCKEDLRLVVAGTVGPTFCSP